MEILLTQKLLIGKFSVISSICLAAFVLAHKYCNDITIKLSGFAQVGGVSAKEMAGLEWQFLQDLNYEMYVGEELFGFY